MRKSSFQRKLTLSGERSRRLSDEGWMYDLEGELEALIAGIESGTVEEFPSEYDE